MRGIKPIVEWKEIYKVEMWLVELKSILESDALIQPPDVAETYREKAKEIKEFLDKR